MAELDAKVEEQTRPFAAEIERLDTVPGVDRRVIEVMLAEVGADMKPVPSDGDLASWAGMCPGNDFSLCGHRCVAVSWRKLRHRQLGHHVTARAGGQPADGAQFDLPVA